MHRQELISTLNLSFPCSFSLSLSLSLHSLSTPSSLRTGGTLGIGGWRASGMCSTGRFTSFYRISEGDVVIQDGVICSWIISSSWAELYTHETGGRLYFVFSGCAS